MSTPIVTNSDLERTPPTPLMRGRVRIGVNCVGIATELLACVAIAANLGVARPLLVLLAMLFVPGAAALTQLAVDEVLTAAAIVIAISLATDITGGLILAWAHLWHPYVLAAVIGAVAFVMFGIDLWRAFRGSPDE